MQQNPRRPRDESAVESPDSGGGCCRRTNIESPVDADAGDDTPEAHTPRQHPPVEEPEEAPAEHAPEIEPDSDPDADSDPRRRPPRPGKAPH